MILSSDTTNHWSTVISVILNFYFSQLTTICVLQHKDYDLQWSNAVNFKVYLHINALTLNETFARDIYNYSSQDERFGFVVFQDDIPKFTATFRIASVYSKWRSIYNRFLFIYAKKDQHDDYFQDLFFKKFSIKSTKFVGSLYEKPHALIALTTYNAVQQKFEPFVDLYPAEKLKDLQGREIIVGAFDYRPSVAVDYERRPQYYDYAEDNVKHLAHIDGTEMRILHTFCANYNCTVQVDTTEKAEWGDVYPNFTGFGLIGMLLEGRTHIAMGAMYLWDESYAALDLTTFVGRSGVTCLVPISSRITSWTLPLRPFQFTLWLGIFGCLVLEAVSLLVARYFEQIIDDHNEKDNASSWWISLQFGFTTTLKLFISQSSDYKVNSLTVRVVLFASYMIDIIVTSIFGGGLSAILTLPTLEEAADSVLRLYRHNLTWAGSSYGWIVAIEDDTSNPITQRLLSNFRVFNMEELRAKAKTDNMGFVVERMLFGHFGNGDFLTPPALERLKLMSDDIYNLVTVGTVARLWAHLPKYNDFILLWHSSGFTKYWEWKIVAEYMNAREQHQVAALSSTNFNVGPVKLDMKNFAGLMVLWLVGILFSIVIFTGEWFVYGMVKKFESKGVISYGKSWKGKLKSQRTKSRK